MRGIPLGESLAQEKVLQWFLSFIQRDLDTLRKGDWENLYEDILNYILEPRLEPTNLGSKLIQRNSPTGFQFSGKSKEEGIREAQRELKVLLNKWKGDAIISIPEIRINVTSRTDFATEEDLESGKKTRRLRIKLVNGSLAVHLQWAFLRVLDHPAIDPERLRRCIRGVAPDHIGLDVPPCGQWFYAQDFRQNYCDQKCNQLIRSSKFLKVKREEINKKRRKGNRKRTR